MDFRLTTLNTLIVLIVGLVIGVVSAWRLSSGTGRIVWSFVVSATFMIAGCAAVIFEFSWMFTDPQRFYAQCLAVGAVMTAIVFAVRVSD